MDPYLFVLPKHYIREHLKTDLIFNYLLIDAEADHVIMPKDTSVQHERTASNLRESISSRHRHEAFSFVFRLPSELSSEPKPLRLLSKVSFFNT